MGRWLRIARAELVRDFVLSVRYPMELGTGLFIMYIIFMGIYFGGKQISGGLSLDGQIEGLVIGYTMLFFALMALNTMSIDIENEARQGTLEQVFLCAPNYLGLLWVRAVVHLMLGSIAVIFLSFAIQASTGRFVVIEASQMLPALAIIVLTVLGLCGFGLLLGGLSLLFKRIGQLSSIIQFSLFFPAFSDLSMLSAPVFQAILHFPFIRGVVLLRQMLVGEISGEHLANGLVWLTLDCAAFVILGSLAFAWMEQIARKQGSLSHY